MKILHLVPNYYPSIGGIQSIFQNVSERLVSQYGDEVTVFTTNALHSVHSRNLDLLPKGLENLRGVNVQRFSFTRSLIPILRKLLVVNRFIPLPGSEYIQLMRTGPISFSLWSAIQKTQMDVMMAAPFNYLHLYYPNLNLQRRRKPLVYMGALHIPTDGVIKPSMILRAINSADAYIAFTNYERDILIRNGALENKIRVIGLGVDLDLYAYSSGNSFRQKYGIGDAPLVAFLGRQTAYKGIDTLLDAMRQVWQEYPETWVLIAGSPTDFSAKISQIIADFPEHYKKRVVHMERFDAITEGPELFSACDIFVTVSSQESFGIVYLEAWACKKPVVGARIGAVKNLIKEGIDGMLVSYGNVQELAKTLVDLISKPDFRDQIGNNGYQKVKLDYTWDAVTCKVRSIYESIV